MQRVMGRGLAGKARRSHKMNRAARLQSRQLILEYLEAESEPDFALRTRAIPVRGLGERGTRTTPRFEHVAFADDPQLELPLGVSEQFAADGVCVIKARRPLGSGMGHRKRTHTVQNARDIGTRRTERDDLGRSNGTEDGFSFRRFFYGCVLGGTVALILFFVVRAIAG